MTAHGACVYCGNAFEECTCSTGRWPGSLNIPAPFEVGPDMHEFAACEPVVATDFGEIELRTAAAVGFASQGVVYEELYAWLGRWRALPPETRAEVLWFLDEALAFRRASSIQTDQRVRTIEGLEAVVDLVKLLEVP